jgi:hypothetical protein
MKKSVALIALIISCFTAIAQDKSTLEKNALTMYNNTVNGNYEALIAETYPKIFEVVPKDKMLESLKGMLNGDGYIMDIVDTPPNFEYGPIKKIGDGYYCIINHDLLMKMTFKEYIGTEESKAMIDNFKKAMKTDDVVFNPKYNSFTMKKRADVIAISDALTNNQWMFLNRTGSALMAKIFTEDVRKEMGL